MPAHRHPRRAVTSFTSNGIAHEREGPRGDLPIVLVLAGEVDSGHGVQPLGGFRRGRVLRTALECAVNRSLAPSRSPRL